jgi:hypothetical protein
MNSFNEPGKTALFLTWLAFTMTLMNNSFDNEETEKANQKLKAQTR